MPIEETAMTPPFQELREMLEKATKGPWYTLDQPWLPTDAETAILAESNDPHVARFICDFDLWALDQDDRKSENPDDDAALIVAAVNALPELLDRSDRLARIEQVDDDELLQRLIKAAELTNGLEVGRDCEEYSFARSPDFQAMTYNEDAFRALKALPEAADALRAYRARLELTGDFINGPDGIECRDDTIKLQDERIARQQARIAELEKALIRLRDCDWVISLPDRMDAVRDIAREALKGGEHE